MPDSLSNAALKIRLATIDDVPTIFKLIQDLAAYEKLAHEVTGSEELLKEHLFGKKVYIEVILAEIGDQAAGLALFFHNYSTFLTKPGIYLEDLFVVPEYRRQGVGKALISSLAKLAVERDCGRLDWSVLDWNVNAIAFYEKIGATVLPDWRICRVTGNSLQELAEGIRE
jgi:GNAT superfamily N-acetyltransferase